MMGVVVNNRVLNGHVLNEVVILKWGEGGDFGGCGGRGTKGVEVVFDRLIRCGKG